MTGIMALTACASGGAGGPLSLNSKTPDIQSAEGYLTDFPTVTIDEIARNRTKDVFKIGDTADVSVYNVDALTNTYVVDVMALNICAHLV